MSDIEAALARRQRASSSLDSARAVVEELQSAFEDARDEVFALDFVPEPIGTIRVETTDGWMDMPVLVRDSGWCVLARDVRDFSVTHESTTRNARAFETYYQAERLMRALAEAVPNAVLHLSNKVVASGPDAVRVKDALRKFEAEHG